jgi:hypothetical protein
MMMADDGWDEADNTVLHIREQAKRRDKGMWNDGVIDMGEKENTWEEDKSGIRSGGWVRENKRGDSGQDLDSVMNGLT